MSAHVELYRETTSTYEPVVDLTTGYLKNRTVDHPNSGKWHWRYVSNGRPMADSRQGYSRRVDCLNGCLAVLGGTCFREPIDNRPLELERWAIQRGGRMAATLIEIRDLTKAVSA